MQQINGKGSATGANGSSFEDRCAKLVSFFSERTPDSYCSRIGEIEIACKLFRDSDPSSYMDHLQDIIDDPHGDMFWMLPMTLLHFVGKDRLPEGTLQQMRSRWTTYTPYRGDTENHWLMYYASMYLMSQEYPDDNASQWFNGKSSTENHSEAREYLEFWFGRVIKEGLNEFDSPHYMPFYLAPVALLSGFSTSARMAKNATSMLDLLVADFAADSINGIYAGAHSRVYPEPLLERSRNGSTSFGWLLFGNCDFNPDSINIVLDRMGYRPHGAAVYLAISGYRPDAVLNAIATDRKEPYVHVELKRSRTRIRRHLPRSARVYKKSFVCEDYVLGSIDGGLVQPIQQHSWELQWTPVDGQKVYNLLFCLHPYWSEDEMATFFPEEPELLADRVLNEKKPTYTSEDKWTGGSPYQRIFQSGSALIVLFDIPPGTRYPHTDTYISRYLDEVTHDGSGWIVGRGGKAMVGVHPLTSVEWIDEGGGDRRLRSHSLNSGIVVQVAPDSEYASVSSYLDALKARKLTTSLEAAPRVIFESLNDGVLDFEFGKIPTVNGVPVDFDNWPLFAGPFINVNDDGEILLSGGGSSRKLEFDLE